jgi:hypothetical protein
MNILRTGLAALALAAALPAVASAQLLPLSVEARGGAYIPTGDFADGLNTGFGFGGNVAYRVIPMLDIYAGYSWQRFGVEDDEEFEGATLDLDDSGFAFGARLHLPAAPNLGPWVRAGVIMHQLKFTGSDGGISVSLSTDRAVGAEIGGGLAIPLMPSLSLTPGVSFRTYKPRFEGATSDEPVQYFGLELGARFAF